MKTYGKIKEIYMNVLSGFTNVIIINNQIVIIDYFGKYWIFDEKANWYCKKYIGESNV